MNSHLTQKDGGAGDLRKRLGTVCLGVGRKARICMVESDKDK